ncbi:DUF6404 family protein [Marimonas sp. MJW-29]|uniref:DUF6404 family protein n=1 Tax=Sulfitobacter sediminis TaxID=3234186 RepID=A0ABV3RIG4_9RHOB
MGQSSFEDRLARLREKEAQATPQQPNARKAPEVPHGKPASNRRERLILALAHLERGGVTGAYAYAPAFRALARAGIIVKPLHYRSWIGLVIFFLFLFSAVTVLAVVIGVLMGHLPRPIRSLIEAGPVVYLMLTLTFGIGFAAVHKIKAAQIGLPRWRDL